jgi:hypothetical protein
VGGINIRPWRLQTSCRSLCCFLFLEEENDKKEKKMTKNDKNRKLSGLPIFQRKMERFVFIGKLKYFTKEEKILNLILKLLN